MEGKLSIEDLARRTGQSVERLREWRAIGLIGAPNEEGFAPEDAVRVRLVQLFIHRGIEPGAVRDWVKGGEMERHVALLSPRPGETTHSVTEAAEQLGLKVGWIRDFLGAAGLPPLADALGEEDIEALRMCKAALKGGFPEDALLQFVRVFTDAMRRVADTQAHLFHFHIRRGLQARGVTDSELTEAIWAASDELTPLTEPALLYFYRRALREAIQETAVLELAEQAGLLGSSEVPGQMHAAIVFVDLASFTPLAEAMGDLKTAEVLERFSVLVRQAVNRWEGHIVKQIGDAFMLAFHEPRSAVACALQIEEQVSKEPQFPAVRSGVHWGPMLYREGDYVGANVNLASRVAAEAQRHQVLVTTAVRKEASGLEDVEFVLQGRRNLKGVAEEMDLFEARRSGVASQQRAVDPVCGMELGPAEVAARLSLSGRERVFCSQECLRRYIATPDKYEPTGV